jgi:hypothetical protein
LGKGWDINPWNRAILQGLANQMLTEWRRKKPGYDAVDVDWLVNEFTGQLRTSRNAWMSAQPRYGETTEAAVTRFKENIDNRTTKAVANGRKSTVSSSLSPTNHYDTLP